MLVNYEKYDPSLDMWSVGLILAGMVKSLNAIFSNLVKIFQKEPLFRGLDRVHQLVTVVKMLGTQDFVHFVNKYKIPCDDFMMKTIGW